MAMFGAFGRLFGNGGNPNSVNYGVAPSMQDPGMLAPGPSDQPQNPPSPPMASQPQPPAAPIGFQPHKLGFGDKLGLAGDIFTGNPVTQKRLDGDYQSDLDVYKMNTPAPVYVPGIGLVRIDPATGRPTTIAPEPAKVPTIAQNASYLDSQQPGLGKQYLTSYATNGGGQGPATMVVNGQQFMRPPTGMATAPQPSAEDVTRLRSNPHEQGLFEQIYGPGSAARFLNPGGVAPTAPAPFPIR